MSNMLKSYPKLEKLFKILDVTHLKITKKRKQHVQ